MRRSYGLTPWSDRHLAVVTVVLTIGVWAGQSGGRAAIAACCAVIGIAAVTGWAMPAGTGRPRWALVVGVTVAMILGVVRGGQAWDQAVPRQLGPYTGWARLVDDPYRFGNGTRLTVEIDGERFDAWFYGTPQRRVADRQAGEWMWLEGRRQSIRGGRDRAALRHVVGRLSVAYAGDWREGGPLARSANRVRRSVRGAAESTMEAGDAALFAGLVLGDDTRQSAAMVDQFRASGLSHLTAVSGQNVTLLMILLAPVVRRIRGPARWAAQMGVVVWLAMATRFEPSVLRAAVMACFGFIATARGRPTSAVRLLAGATAVLIVADPLLVWRVGFWLSVTATVGVCVIAPALERWLVGPRWFVVPFSVTLGAQVAVALPSVLVFGRMPAVAVITNLLAVPVAGVVMAVGLPLALLAELASPVRGVAMLVPRFGTRWVRLIAAIGARLEPSGTAELIAWAVIISAVLVWWAHGRGQRRA